MSDDRRVIVIGSGPTGAMAALTLLQKGVPITMLESGTTFPGGLLVRLMGRNVYRKRPDLGDGQSGRHVSDQETPALWFHALVPGGLSNYWTGAVPRFAPQDFTEGERLHEKYRWPLTYDDLVPYYEQVERLIGVTGTPQNVPNLPASIVAHARRLPKPWEQIAACAEGFGQGLTMLPMADVRPWMVTRSGTAFNSFTRILPMLQRFPHFQLRLGAHALRLEWDNRTRRVSSVHYLDRTTGSEKQVAGAAFVVAAGPVSSTKLLFDSACPDFPNGLGDTEGLLGRYLHEHVKDWFVVELDRPLPRLGHAAYLTRAPYEESPPLLGASCTIGTTSLLDKVLSITPLGAKRFGVLIWGTMIPVESNCVKLRPDATDEFGLPMLDIRLQYNSEALQNLAKTRERLAAILESAGYCVTLPASPAQPRPGESVHFGGTVRMHSSPQFGMLNQWNRLHAVDNVVVPDASSFTTGVEKNPLLTSMALASRSAERLAIDLKTYLLVASR